MCSRLDDPSEYEGPRTEAGKRLRDGVRNGNGGLDLARQIAAIETEAAQRALDEAEREFRVRLAVALTRYNGGRRAYWTFPFTPEQAQRLVDDLFALQDRGADREDVK